MRDGAQCVDADDGQQDGNEPCQHVGATGQRFREKDVEMPLLQGNDVDGEDIEDRNPIGEEEQAREIIGNDDLGPTRKIEDALEEAIDAGGEGRQPERQDASHERHGGERDGMAWTQGAAEFDAQQGHKR